MLKKLRRKMKERMLNCYNEKKNKAAKKLKKKLPRRVQQFLRRRFLKKHSFDFSYFSYVWDLDIKTSSKDCEEHDCDLEAIKKFLYDLMSYCHDFKEQSGYLHKGYIWTCEEVAQDLRVYLKYLGRWNHTHTSGVWRAMSKVEDDWTLIQLSNDLMGHLWD